MEDKDKLVEEIVKWFLSDTITLLDNVLTDDIEDPQISPNTVLRRFKIAFSFNKMFYNEDKETDVFEWMLKSGYTEEHVELFKWKINDEYERYKDWWEK